MAELPCGPGRERLLVVDDDPSIARMLQVFLNNQGYATTILGSSRKAMEIFRARPQAFDLVITDQTMPDMTGEELAANLLALRSDIPIILCTGYSPMIDEVKARQQGIRAYHTKPVALKDLAATIRRLLDESETRNQKSEANL